MRNDYVKKIIVSAWGIYLVIRTIIIKSNSGWSVHWLKDKSFFTCLLICLLLTNGCATITPVETNYKEGLKAESHADLKTAAEYYQKAFDAANNSRNGEWHIPSKLFHDYRANSSLAETKITSSIIYDDLKRVSANYIFKGRLVSEEKFPITKIKISIVLSGISKSTDSRSLDVITDESGTFSFLVFDNQDVSINISNELLSNVRLNFKGPSTGTKYSNPRSTFSVLLGEGTANQRVENINPGQTYDIEVPYSKIGAEFYRIKSLFNDKNYKGAMEKSKTFISTYKDINGTIVGEIKSLAVDAERAYQEDERNQMYATFKNIFSMDKARDYDSIIPQGKSYLEKYRHKEGSRSQEMEKLINEATEVAGPIEKAKVEEENKRRAEEVKAYAIYLAEDKKRVEGRRKELEDQAASERKKEAEIKRRQEAKRKAILARCNGHILTLGEFYQNNNPYTDTGSCVEIEVASFQMTSATSGLFRYNSITDIVYIDFQNPFKGRVVKGIAKILGVYDYPTKLGGSNSVPHLKMLEIEMQ